MSKFFAMEHNTERRVVQRQPNQSQQGRASSRMVGGLPARDMPSLLLYLQRTVGNTAVNQLLRQYSDGAASIQREEADEDPATSMGAVDQSGSSAVPVSDQLVGGMPDNAGSAATASGGAPGLPVGGDVSASPGSAGAQQASLSGSIEPLEDPAPLAKVGGDEGPKADVVAASNRNEIHPVVELRVNADMSLDAAQQPGSVVTGPSKRDSVKDALTVDSTLTKGGVTWGATEFGDEEVSYKADNISWTRDAAASTINIAARMFLDIHWDTRSRDRQPVTSENDPIVKADTWASIRDDLKPDDSGRPTRDTYWAPDLTEKHEKFHASDDIGQANHFLPTVKTWLDSQVIAVPAGPDPSAAIETKVKDLVEQARQKVKADGWAHYDKDSGAGEDRAYADGKSSYQGRVDAIAARATKEKWA